MKALLFILRKTLKNAVRITLRKPAALIGYVIMLGLMGFGFYNMMRDGSTTTLSSDIYIAIITIVTFLIIIPTIIQGINVAGTNFSIADVNFLFTSPISPGKILLYSQIKQMGMSLFVSLIMIFQVPLLKTFFNFSIEGILIFLIAWFILLITSTILNMSIYALLVGREGLKKATKYTIYTGISILLLITALQVITSDNPITGLLGVLSHKYLSYIPIVGWYRHLFYSAIFGFAGDFIWSFTSIAIYAVIAGGLVIKKLGIDYYEDAIETAEKLQRVKDASKKGENSFELLYGKNKKVKKVEHRFSLIGGGAILQKQLLEHKKKGFYFINFRTILTSFITIVIAYLSPVQGNPEYRLLLMLAVATYLLLLSSVQGSWLKELQKPFIYLIPEYPYKKLFLSTAVQIIKSLVDGSIMFIIGGVLFKISPIVVFLCILAYAIINLIFTFIDVLSQRLFGRINSKFLGMYFKIQLTIILIVPGVLTVALAITTAGLSSIIALLILNGINLALALLLAIPAAGSFKHPELNNL